ncbi:MAG: DUF11 domain-containing protein [Sphingomonadaceae bacterium]|nr:DUF11 domain-containing protein [Sphingomonadaceae bacterium]
MRTVLRIWQAASALLALVLLCAFPGQALAQSITNIAEASWDFGSGTATTRSNEVTFDVSEPVVHIDTYRIDSQSSTQAVLRASQCGGGSLPLPGGANGSSTVGITPETTYYVGEHLIFSVTSPRANTDPGAIDHITVVLTTQSGDREELIVYETANNSGVFMGSIPTAEIPPAPVQGDCELGVRNGEEVSIEGWRDGLSSPIATAKVNILADPFGLVFDSEDGTVVSGARVTLVDAATGLPATVFADDGVTPWPSTVISGQTVVDGAGNTYVMQPGEYRFPLAPLGDYRIVVEPPAPYSAPSTATPAELSGLTRPNGDPFTIADASYGGVLTLASVVPIRVDIPLDRPGIAVGLTKTASRAVAQPGDPIFYTVTLRNNDPSRSKRDVTLVDTPSEWLRLRPESVRVDGVANSNVVTISPDGRQLSIFFDEVAPGGTHIVTYAMTVRPDAPAGRAVNRAQATDWRGDSVIASASVDIQDETIGSRMTLIGRITEGSCSAPTGRRGIPGVRVMLEDGSFAVTDADGRYHFEGLRPGTHVVQALGMTLPEGGYFIDCNDNTNSAGSAVTQFVRGQGGSLVVRDFFAVLPAEAIAALDAAREAKKTAPAADAEAAEGAKGAARGDAPADSSAAPSDSSDAEAAGADTDWLALGDGPIEFLFPAMDHNPRAPAVRAVIRHKPGQKVELTANGKPVDAMTYDGVRKDPKGRFVVSTWRGIALDGDVTRLRAVVRNADSSVAEELTRDVHWAAAAARAEFLPGRSKLIADGATKPMIAVRLIDRKGRPVRSGVSGQVTVNAPYESAQALEAMQLRQLSGLGGASPTWTVDGDDGVALIELAPTLVSGPLHLEFSFADDQVTRTQEIESWIEPGDQEWTLVGLAEAAVGAIEIADQMERTGRFDSDLGNNARVAFYTRGKILGKFLITAAYDSAKQEDETRLQGYIDPNAYYTVFADGSHRQFDAASREKLYVRIESRSFYALYGDFETGFDQTQLARYQRAATGVKAEARLGAIHTLAFASEIATRYRRDEMQGKGISGPYRLSSRGIIPNSERVAIETRDRFRSELVVERRELSRFIDYDIDLLSGTITFKQPVLSRDFDLNPQFIVIDYEIDSATGQGEWNAGVRSDITVLNGALRIGATAITDKGDGFRTDLAALDIRARIGTDTELRAEVGGSRSEGSNDYAWMVEAEHHTGNFDMLAYARSLDSNYGVGQQSGAERGRRKIGFDARYSVSQKLSFTGSAWRDDSLTDNARRNAAQVRASWRSARTDAHIGLAHFADKLDDGTRATSTLLEGGVAQRLFDNKLELSASTSIALNASESIDLPARHRFGARYAVTNDIRLVGSYEIAKGEAIDARTLRGGIEVAPWSGAIISGSLGQQDIDEYGKRSFAAFGLAQSLPVSEELTLDFTLDGNRSLGGDSFDGVINPAQPVASGGHLGADGTQFEDFTAVTLGGTWRKERWTATLRGEYRDGEEADRTGLTFGAIRQLGEGSAVGTGFIWTRATGSNGASTEVMDGAISLAHRPDESAFTALAKIEFRSDKVTGAVLGETGPAGRTALTVNGDAQSRRVIASVSTNLSPRGEEDGKIVRRHEFGLFVGGRYNFDSYGDFDLSGVTVIGGADARIGIGDSFEIGGRATVRSNLKDGATSFAIGPQIGFVPADGMLLTLGYNIEGFRDRDFSDARSTDKGFYASIRMKFDSDTLGFLGIGR